MFYPGLSLDEMLQGYREQYLKKKGWIRSVETRSAVDVNGDAVPWLTYPAIEFLTSTVRPEWRVFEFGSGSSTIWWGRRVAQVLSVDHDPAWLDRIGPSCGANVDMHLITPEAGPEEPVAGLIDRYFKEVTEPQPPPDEGYRFRAGLLSAPFRAYAAQILRFPPESFDVVVIDGMARSLCTWLAVEHARPKRFVIFDNSDRDVYAPAYDLLKKAGYHRIDFWGTGPINPYEWCTSVFLRSVEVLP